MQCDEFLDPTEAPLQRGNEFLDAFEPSLTYSTEQQVLFYCGLVRLSQPPERVQLEQLRRDVITQSRIVSYLRYVVYPTQVRGVLLPLDIKKPVRRNGLRVLLLYLFSLWTADSKRERGNASGGPVGRRTRRKESTVRWNPRDGPRFQKIVHTTR